MSEKKSEQRVEPSQEKSSTHFDVLELDEIMLDIVSGGGHMKPTGTNNSNCTETNFQCNC